MEHRDLTNIVDFIERAIAWALCATDPTPNPPPFAA